MGLSVESFKTIGKDVGFTEITNVTDEKADKAQGCVLSFKSDIFVALCFLSHQTQNSSDQYDSLQLFTKFADTPTLEAVNEWNENHRFVKCYTANNNLHFEMDLILIGMPDDLLKVYFGIWRSSLAEAVLFNWENK